MEPTTLNELEWLHDCPLLGILYETSNEDGQSIELTLTCPPNLGYSQWEGKKLMLSAIDVAMSSHFVFATMGPETIDAVRPGISTSFHKQTMDARRSGIRMGLEFTISLHSGSSIEIICKEIRVGIIEGAS